MNVILFNLDWMFWNILLAVVGVGFGVLMLKTNIKILKLLWFFLWLIFIPNSIYIVTDLYHLTWILPTVEYVLYPIIFLQFILLIFFGVVTFLIGVYIFEKQLKTLKYSEVYIQFSLILLNFIISFGVMVGRFQRTNSWEVFSHPLRVVNDVLNTVFTIEHILYTLLFGFFCNILYFGLRKYIKIHEKNISRYYRGSAKR